jgi:hypothetical protein
MKNRLKRHESPEANQSSANRSTTSRSPAKSTLRSTLLLAFLLATSSTQLAAQSIHLLGFVDTLCDQQTHCFELLVKPEFQSQLGKRITVRFSADTRIFDPENYELTLLQQNIVPGSHLRLLLETDSQRGPDSYRASFIWIGD